MTEKLRATGAGGAAPGGLSDRGELGRSDEMNWGGGMAGRWGLRGGKTRWSGGWLGSRRRTGSMGRLG